MYLKQTKEKNRIVRHKYLGRFARAQRADDIKPGLVELLFTDEDGREFIATIPLDQVISEVNA